MEINSQKSSAVKYAAAGALAGAVNGFFGGGGGMILIPLFIGWAKMDSHRAFATSIASIMPMCAVSAAVYMASGGVTLSAALPFLIGGALGGAAGGKTFRRLPVDLLRKLFAVLMIFGGVRSVL